MRSFYFQPGKNAFMALSAAAVAMYMANAWWQDGGLLMFLGAATLGAAALKGAQNALSSQPALRFDHDRLWVRTTFAGTQEVPWSDVQRIALEVYTVRRFGIPVSRTENIIIWCNGGLFGTRRLGLSANTLQLPGGGASELLEILKQAHVASVGVAGVAMAGAGRHGWGVAPPGATVETDAGFDPDAAIARYMQSRQSEPNEEAASPSPAPQAAMPQPARLQRPVFGKRVA